MLRRTAVILAIWIQIQIQMDTDTLYTDTRLRGETGHSDMSVTGSLVPIEHLTVNTSTQQGKPGPSEVSVIHREDSSASLGQQVLSTNQMSVSYYVVVACTKCKMSKLEVL